MVIFNERLLGDIMKPGKLWTPILKRSVHNIINYGGSKSAAKLLIGEDAADFLVDDVTMLTSSAIREGTEPEMAYYAVHNAFNNIFAAYGIPKSAIITLCLKRCEEEHKLKQWIRNVNSACKDISVTILGGHTCVSTENEYSVLSVTALGRKREFTNASFINPLYEEDSKKHKVDYSEYRVIMTGYIGLEGTALLLAKYYDILKKTYSTDYLDSINSYNHLSIKEEAEAIFEYSEERKRLCGDMFVVPLMHDISEGGITSALWELAEYLSCGLEIDIEKIRLKQLTIEICEFLDISPYILKTCGSLLIVVDKADELLLYLHGHGIHAVDIGKTTDKKERIYINKDEVRYIEPFRGDSMYLVETGRIK